MSPQIRRLTRLVSVLCAENPGPMTLEGTNSLLLRAPGSDGVVVVDPGPDLPEAQLAMGKVGQMPVLTALAGHPEARVKVAATTSIGIESRKNRTLPSPKTNCGPAEAGVPQFPPPQLSLPVLQPGPETRSGNEISCRSE